MNSTIGTAPLDEIPGCGPLLPEERGAPMSLRQQILQFVRANGHAARAEIARALNISAGSATTITADLIATGILREVGDTARDPGRGRPRVALEVVPEAAHVIGIKLSFKTHTAVLTDFAGNIVANAALQTQLARRPLSALLDEIDQLIANLLNAAGMERSAIHAVAIGLPGIVDHATGHIVWSSLLQDRDQDLGSVFAERFAIPLYLENDANMLTLAELWFGAGRAMRDFAVVTIENGVGMGFVLNNRLYRGTHGMGLELGHTKVHLDGALCRCGQRGCLEAYLADYALAREAGTALDLPIDTQTPPEEMLNTLFKRAKAGDTAAQTIFRRAGRYLSIGLSNVVQLFDPPVIILSGERMQYDYLYEEDVFKEMQTLTLSEGRKPCQIEIHAWDDLVWARGATALALSAVTDTMFSQEGIA